MMTEEQIKQMVDEYAAEYVPMYQKVAKRKNSSGY